MLSALEETPFVLQGPKPLIPPPAWEAYWLPGALAVGLAVLAVYAVRRFLRQGRPQPAPATQLELALRLAETQPAGEAIAQATRAFRGYLAALEPKAAATLSTEELLAALGGLPLFLPARQPLRAALREADAAKFAGAALDPALLIAALREAARRIEDARATFARTPLAPLVPTARPVAPLATDTPPPLPVPPPLPPRKDPA